MAEENLEGRSDSDGKLSCQSQTKEENLRVQQLRLSKICARADAGAHAYAREVKLGEYLAHLKTADIRYRACA